MCWEDGCVGVVTLVASAEGRAASDDERFYQKNIRRVNSRVALSFVTCR